MIARRTCLIALMASVFISFASIAQQRGKIWRVGFLASSTPSPEMLDALRAGLQERGYVEGKSVSIEVRWTEGAYGDLRPLAKDLVNKKVDLIFAWGTPAVAAAKQASDSLPIVMVGIADPVGSGFVASLARPGGNITGTTNLNRDLSAKLVELFVKVIPGNANLAVLINPTNPAHIATLKETQAGARSLGRGLQIVEIRNAEELDAAFETMAAARNAGVIVLADPIVITQRSRIANLALRHRLPTIFARQENVESGGLMAYGPNLLAQVREGTNYVDRIFKGASPGDLPISQPMLFDLVVNLKTAKALGLTITPDIMVQATRVIQ